MKLLVVCSTIAATDGEINLISKWFCYDCLFCLGGELDRGSSLSGNGVKIVFGRNAL